MNSKKMSTKTLVGVALFTAIVVVLQFLGSFIRFGPFSIQLVMVPIVVGAAMYGVGAGAWLGFAFGVTVLLSGDAGVFLAVSPLGTVVVVLVKGIVAGLAAGLVFRLLEKVNRYLAVIVAAVIGPVCNTGVFLIGCRLFFLDTVTGWAEAAGFSGSVGTYMIVGLVGVNFLVELLIDVVLSPVILRILRAAGKEKD